MTYQYCYQHGEHYDSNEEANREECRAALDEYSKQAEADAIDFMLKHFVEQSPFYLYPKAAEYVAAKMRVQLTGIMREVIDEAMAHSDATLELSVL